MAVQIVGLDSVPVAGDEFNVLPTEQEVETPPSSLLQQEGSLHSIHRSQYVPCCCDERLGQYREEKHPTAETCLTGDMHVVIQSARYVPAGPRRSSAYNVRIVQAKDYAHAKDSITMLAPPDSGRVL